MKNDKFAWYAGWSMIAITVVLAVFLPLAAGCGYSERGAAIRRSAALQTKDGVRVDAMMIDGHEYLASYSASSAGGVSLIHSASCPCQEEE